MNMESSTLNNCMLSWISPVKPPAGMYLDQMVALLTISLQAPQVQDWKQSVQTQSKTIIKC